MEYAIFTLQMMFYFLDVAEWEQYLAHDIHYHPTLHALIIFMDNPVTLFGLRLPATIYKYYNMQSMIITHLAG